MSYCKWIIDRKEYVTGKVVDSHRCPFKATLGNGFCRRHDPVTVQLKLADRLVKADKALKEHVRKSNLLQFGKDGAK